MRDSSVSIVEVKPVPKDIHESVNSERVKRRGGISNLPPALANGLVIHTSIQRAFTGATPRPIDSEFLATFDEQVPGSGKIYSEKMSKLGQEIALSMESTLPPGFVHARMTEIAFQCSPNQLRHVKKGYGSDTISKLAIDNGYQSTDELVFSMIHHPDFSVDFAGHSYSTSEIIAQSKLSPHNPVFGFLSGVYSYSAFSLNEDVTKNTFLKNYEEVAALVTTRLDGWVLSAKEGSEAAKLIEPFRQSMRGAVFGRNPLFDLRQSTDTLRLWQEVSLAIANHDIVSTIFEIKSLTKAVTKSKGGQFVEAEFYPDHLSHKHKQDILHASMTRQLFFEKISGLNKSSPKDSFHYQPPVGDSPPYVSKYLSLPQLEDPNQLSYTEALRALDVWDQVLLHTDHYLVKAFFPIVSSDKKIDPRLILKHDPQYSVIKVSSAELASDSSQFCQYLVNQIEARHNQK